MEREANYAAVGAFVVLVIAMAGLFIYWYSDAREHRDYTRYEIYFGGSVSGLTRGSPVRYLGVDVGRVAQMRIDSRDSNRVQVIADIDSSAPVSEQTVAELSLQGVTGLLYIDLVGNSGNRSLFDRVPSQRYPVIRSARSNFDVFLSSLPNLVASADDIAKRAARILSDDNIDSLTHTLANVEKASGDLPATLREMRGLVTDLRSTSTEIRTVVASVGRLTNGAGPGIEETLEHVRTVADNLAEATEQLGAFVADNRRDLRSFTREGLPEFERFLREGRAAAGEIRELSRSLRENPSQIIYQPAPTGVEIPP